MVDWYWGNKPARSLSLSFLDWLLVLLRDDIMPRMLMIFVKGEPLQIYLTLLRESLRLITPSMVFALCQQYEASTGFTSIKVTLIGIM